VAVTLRRAVPADVPTLRSWDDLPHVAEASGADDAFDWASEVPRDVDWREILVVEDDGRPVGAVVVIDPAREETRYWGDVPGGLRAIDVWLGPPDALGRGIGTAAMRLALARCFAAPEVRAVLIDPLVANVRAIRFYNRLGFRPVERRRFGEDDCLVMRIGREDWDAQDPILKDAS
jgi:aminoglycoside 6'-N-acetyltransferase